MSQDTHRRAVLWAVERLAAREVDPGEPFHLRDVEGRRMRVAGRHIKGRQPNYFPIAPTLAGDPFDDLVVVLFENDWSVRYAYRLPLEAVQRHHSQPGQQGCRLSIRGDDSWRSDPAVQSLG